MKQLFALLLLCASSVTFGQTATVAREYPFDLHIFWNDSVPVVLNYSLRDAPPSAPISMVTKVLGDIEARINGLNLPGLSVRAGRRDLQVPCASRTRSEVLICWEARQGETSNFQVYSLTDDVNYWHEANIILGSNTVWDEALLYKWMMHQVVHVIGFAHPQGENTSILNGAPDLTQLDIDGLKLRYRADRCALTYANGVVTLPYVKYMGGAFTGKIQAAGGANFTLVPGSLGRFGKQAFNVPPEGTFAVPLPVPATPCPALQIEANGDLFIPEVKVNGVLYQATLTLANGRFTLKSSTRK
jgi:hypothetical protein